MQDEMRLPRVLNSDLSERARVHPLEMSADLRLRACSTATMRLPDEDPRLEDMPFVEIYTAKGSAGIFRVYDSTEPVSGTRSYALRHAIDTLRDSVWAAKTDYSGTVRGFLSALLARQETARWQLGTCADTGAYTRDKINYDHLDKLLDELRETRDGYYFAYDFTTSPWTLNFLAISGTVDAEMRPSRNLSDASLRRTRNGQANRLYLSVDDGTPTVHNNAASQAIYGVIAGTAGVTHAEAPSPAAWAAQYFADHALPLPSVSGDAFEIVKATGEPWDAFDLGKRVRVAAGRPGFPITLPIESLRYEGLAGPEPEKVRAELKKRLPKFSERLSSASKKADSAGSAADESLKDVQSLSAEVSAIDRIAVKKLTDEGDRLWIYVSPSAPDPLISGTIWIKPGSAVGQDGTYPCEVRYVP